MRGLRAPPNAPAFSHALSADAARAEPASGWSWIVPAAVCAPVLALEIGSIPRLASLPPPEAWIRRAAGRG
jgi:hypothetical protein